MEIVEERSAEIEARTGILLELAGVAVSDLSRERPVSIREPLLSADAIGLATSEDVDVVVEVMGGIDPARSLVEAALTAGHPVVTANKALLSLAGRELAELASANDVDLLYEAAVASAIPVVRPLRESLAGEHIERVMGIVNGTTNFILTRMDDDDETYDVALAEAQRLGLAERDPSADVNGDDAASKAAILASLAFGCDVRDADVHREGISGVAAVDVEFARKLGYVVKLLAIAELIEGGPSISVRVHPAMVPRSHPLASVRGAFNAVFVEGDACGELMFYGRGAGGAAAASAVLGDVIDAARNLSAGAPSPQPRRAPLEVWPREELRSAFYLSVEVVDEPGVLASVARVFGEHGVSIRVMEQVGLGSEARLIFLTHRAREGDVEETLSDLWNLEVVDRVGGVLRVVDDR